MFAVVLLPNFRLQAALRFRDEMQAQPVALLGGEDPKASLLEINAAAAATGVTVGQTSTQGLARCPRLVLVSRSPAQEQAAQAALLDVADAISPEVEATADGCCT